MKSQISIKRMCVITIDFSLFEHRELGIVIFLNMFFNFLRSSRLLSKKLIARKSQYFQSFRAKFFIHLDHLIIVGLGITSLACYIDNHECLFGFEPGKVNQLPIDVLDLEWEELKVSRTDFIWPAFEKYAAHLREEYKIYNITFDE